MLHNLIFTELAKQCKDGTPPKILQILAEHATIANEAKARIETEGTVVRTLKGDVIAHPAIRVHADATKTIAGLLKEWAAPSSALSTDLF